MNQDLMGALDELEKERGISKAVLLDAIEMAIISAYKKNYSVNAAKLRVSINEQTGALSVFSLREVVEEVADSQAEISLSDAREKDPNYEVGDILEEEVTPKNFGRIAAQTAKQVVIQRIREAERSIVYNAYSNREGDVVFGIVQRQEHRNVVVALEKVEAVLPASEQMMNEEYPTHRGLRVYINEVKQSTKGPQVFLSRTHPNLLRHLFEVEVPEIQSGEVEIKSVAREAGSRSKIAVYSRAPNVDPVGSCVGPKGSRVQAIVQELSGEKIDIIPWVEDSAEFISNALSPARVSRVIVDEKNKVARTVVPDDQLSLAIGKEGQNARLSARLTGWKIDIKDETQAEGHPDFQEPKTVLPVVEEVAAPVKEVDLEELSNLTNVERRKSWEERFGASSSAEEKQGGMKPKQKKTKKEKVIKDFSELNLGDFGFSDKKK